MEIFELRYFLEVAKYENIHRASERLRVSPASLSKAIARLETELGTNLFTREGRNIRLTSQGKVLQRKGSEIAQLEESTRLELAGKDGAIQIVYAGPEVLLSKWGLEIGSRIKTKYPLSTFETHAIDDEGAIEQVVRGEAHLAFVTSDSIPRNLTAKTLDETTFLTCVGRGHPLYAAAKSKKSVPIDKVLEYSFVSPSHPLLGKVGIKQSVDGWRDDEFPRKVEYLTSSLKLLEAFVVSGRAIAYLPDYYIKGLDAEVLKITGCPYSCNQKVKVVARNVKDFGWMNEIF